MTQKKNGGETVVGLLTQLKALDLGDLDEQISEKRRELETLESMRKLANVAKNGKPERKPREAKSPEAKISDERDMEILRTYLRSKGATALTQIAADTKIQHLRARSLLSKMLDVKETPQGLFRFHIASA